MEELKEAQKKTKDVGAKFEKKEQEQNAKKTAELMEQGNGEWADTIGTMKEVQQEKTGLQDSVQGASLKQEELAGLEERERRLMTERDILDARMEMLVKEGAEAGKIQKAREELAEAEARLKKAAEAREAAGKEIGALQEKAEKSKLKLLNEHADTDSLLESRADATRRKIAVEEAKKSIEARKKAEEAEQELGRQEEALMKQLPPTLSAATQEWSKVVAMLNELKAEREMLDSQSGFFSRYSLFSATRKRADNAKKRLPDVEQQIRVLEEQVRKAQEQVALARKGGDPETVKKLNAVRLERSQAKEQVAVAKVREGEVQATLRQQEADVSTFNRDLRKQAVNKKLEVLREKDPKLKESREKEKKAKDGLKKVKGDFEKLIKKESTSRETLIQLNTDLVALIGKTTVTEGEAQEREVGIKDLREKIGLEQLLQNDLLVRRRINATERKQQAAVIAEEKRLQAERLKELAAAKTEGAEDLQEGMEQLEELSALEKEAKASAVWALKEVERAQVDLFVAKQNAASEEERVGLEQQILEDWALIARVHNEEIQVDLMTEEGRKKAKKALGDDYPKLELMQRRLEAKVNTMLIKGASPLEIRDALSSVPNSLLPPSLRGELETWQQMQAKLDPSTDVLAVEAMFQEKLEKTRAVPPTPEAVKGKMERFKEMLGSGTLGEGVEVGKEVTEVVASVNEAVKGSLELAEAIRTLQEAGGALSKAEFAERMDEIWEMAKKGKFLDIFKAREEEEVTKEGLAKQLADGQNVVGIAEKILGGAGLALEVIGDVQGIAAWSQEQDIEKKAEMEDAFFEKMMSLGSGVTGFVGSFLDKVPVLGVVSSTLSLIANASARKWHNRYVALAQQAARMVGDALATAFEEAMYREKQLLSRYLAKIAADVTAIAGGIVAMATGGTGIGAAVGAAMAIGAGVIKLGTKVGSWITDKWQMRNRKHLEERAKKGDMEARVQLFREHPKYAKTMIAKEAMKGNGFAKAYCYGHGLSKSMVGKMDEMELTQTLLERHEQANYFEQDNTALEQMAQLAKSVGAAIAKVVIPALEADDKKKATKVCTAWFEAVNDAEALDVHRRSFLTIIDKHQKLIEKAPPDDQAAILDLIDDFTAKLQICIEALRAIYAKTLDVLNVLHTVSTVPEHTLYKERATLLTAALAGI